MQELRIKYRWEALDQESEQISRSRAAGRFYQPEILPNGDTLKQLPAGSRYLLFKHCCNWTSVQKARAALLFDGYPRFKQGYDLAIKLSDIFLLCACKGQAFKTVVRSIIDPPKNYK